MLIKNGLLRREDGGWESRNDGDEGVASTKHTVVDFDGLWRAGGIIILAPESGRLSFMCDNEVYYYYVTNIL